MSPFLFIIILAGMAFAFVLILERMETAKERASGLSEEEAAELERDMDRMARRVETLETLLAEERDKARH
jgi:phage shock protein B